MKIKMTIAVGGDWNFGATHIVTAPDDVPERVALDWLSVGVAVPHDDDAHDALAVYKAELEKVAATNFVAAAAEPGAAEGGAAEGKGEAAESGEDDESAKDRKNRIAREKRAAEKAENEEAAE